MYISREHKQFHFYPESGAVARFQLKSCFLSRRFLLNEVYYLVKIHTNYNHKTEIINKLNWCLKFSCIAILSIKRQAFCMYSCIMLK